MAVNSRKIKRTTMSANKEISNRPIYDNQWYDHIWNITHRKRIYFEKIKLIEILVIERRVKDFTDRTAKTDWRIVD